MRWGGYCELPASSASLKLLLRILIFSFVSRMTPSQVLGYTGTLAILPVPRREGRISDDSKELVEEGYEAGCRGPGKARRTRERMKQGVAEVAGLTKHDDGQATVA